MPDATATSDRLFTVLMAEHDSLKREQDRRMNTRDTIAYWTIGVVLLIGGAAVKNPSLGLAVAPVCVILGWIRLANDRKINQIRDHITTSITPELRGLCGDTPVLTWETEHRSFVTRGSRIANVMIEHLLFVLPGFVTLSLFDPRNIKPAGAVAAIVDAMLLGFMAFQIIVNADYSSRDDR